MSEQLIIAIDTCLYNIENTLSKNKTVLTLDDFKKFYDFFNYYLCTNAFTLSNEKKEILKSIANLLLYAKLNIEDRKSEAYQVFIANIVYQKNTILEDNLIRKGA